MGPILAASGSQDEVFGLATGTQVSAGALEYVGSGGLASGATVSAGGEQFVDLGGVALGTVVLSGGLEALSSGRAMASTETRPSGRFTGRRGRRDGTARRRRRAASSRIREQRLTWGQTYLLPPQPGKASPYIKARANSGRAGEDGQGGGRLVGQGESDRSLPRHLRPRFIATPGVPNRGGVSISRREISPFFVPAGQ